MIWSIDNLLVPAIVAVAALYLARRIWTVVAGRRAGGCGSCASCPASGTDKPQVIGIETLTVRKP